MEELAPLLRRAQAGEKKAYADLVRRFQDMAVGYAYAFLGDFGLAEDAAQEAFIEAYGGLAKVYGPEAFPAWLRRIVFKHCDRLRRGKANKAFPFPGAPGWGFGRGGDGAGPGRSLQAGGDRL